MCLLAYACVSLYWMSRQWHGVTGDVAGRQVYEQRIDKDLAVLGR